MKFIEEPAATMGNGETPPAPMVRMSIRGVAGALLIGAEPKLDGTIPPRCHVTKRAMDPVRVRWWWALEGGRLWYSAGYTRVSRVRYELMSARAWMRVKLEQLLHAATPKPPEPPSPIPPARVVQR